jgi:hypothetical protein
LIIFLVFRLPGVWLKVDFRKGKPEGNRKTGGAVAMMVGCLAFSIQYLMAVTHTMNGGINYGDAFYLSMTMIGWLSILGGISLMVSPHLATRLPVTILKRESKSV